MKKSFLQRVVVGMGFLAAALVWVAPIFAAVGPYDVQPPTWRGQPGTTSQFWMFGTSNPGPIAPDGSLGGAPTFPSTQISVLPQAVWSQTVGTASGVWSLAGGQMNVTVDNFTTPNPVKYMSVQVVWQPIVGTAGGEPILSGFTPGVDSGYRQTTPTAVGPVTGGGGVTLPSGWYETTFLWQIYPNPPEESFVISGNINVDQVIVDTYCVPEPGSLLIASLAGGLLLMFRRRLAA